MLCFLRIVFFRGPRLSEPPAADTKSYNTISYAHL
jgi:hypothetical protein